MSDKQPQKKTPEEREAEEDRQLEKLAQKLAPKLKALEKPQLPYSTCPGCGYLFKTKEEEDRYSECPKCGYTGSATRLRWDSTEEKP